MYESILDRLEVQQTNISARRITGVARSARLAVLHMVAGIITARNLYTQQCGIAIDRAPRTHDSRIQTDAERWLQGLYSVVSWKPKWYALCIADQLLARTGRRKGTEEMERLRIPEEWAIQLLPTAPDMPTRDANCVQSI